MILTALSRKDWRRQECMQRDLGCDFGETEWDDRTRWNMGRAGIKKY